MIDDASALEAAQEILDLIDRDGIADADVDAAAFFKTSTAVDSDEVAISIKKRPARIARIDGGIGLDAVGVFQERAGGWLVAMGPGNDAKGHGRLQIGREKEWIADGKTPVADFHIVAIGHHGGGKIIAAQELNQGHIAGGI